MEDGRWKMEDGRWKMEDYVSVCWLIQRLNGKKNLPLVYVRFGCLCKGAYCK
jgi:hypothetical protein